MNFPFMQLIFRNDGNFSYVAISKEMLGSDIFSSIIYKFNLNLRKQWERNIEG